MNLKELDEFRLADAVKFHQRLNPAIFDNERLDPEVKAQLLLIAEDFMEHLGIDDVEVKDITLSGSNAAYTYTPHSDIDLHIVVDVAKLSNNDVYRELFNSKKVVYNDNHDIKIRGYDVELYVQDSAQPVKSLGEYSVTRDRWIKFPSKSKSNLDERTTREKFIKLVQLSELALRSQDLDMLENLLSTIRKYRESGLAVHGEFGPENLSYKALRSRGIVDRLYKHRDELHSVDLSLDEEELVDAVDDDSDSRELTDRLSNELSEFMQLKTEDYDPNGPPPGPEFQPTMPAGTARVDVSDVYDWYKLGQHISNLKGLGKHDFGKGAPSTIIAFGDEDTEHKYIKDLEKTGLTTTDIDPVDPNQPKGMKRQKVDPTYNVNEDKHTVRFKTLKGKSKFSTTMTVDGKEAGVYQYDSATGRSIAEIFPEFRGHGHGKLLVLNAIYTAAKLGMDFQEDESRTAAYDNVLDSLSSSGYIVDDDGYWYVTGEGEQYLKSTLTEASGYIPSESEKNDPRYCMALTKDVRPDSIKKNAKLLGLGNIQRSGVPPTASTNGADK